MSSLNKVDVHNFEASVINNPRPVLVDFYADWCGPCKAQAPILEAFSGDYEGKVDFVKVDVDKNTELSKQYGVRSIPTLVIFKDGNAVNTHVGLSDRKALSALLNQVA